MKKSIRAFIAFAGFLLMTAPAVNAIAPKVDCNPAIVQLGFVVAAVAITLLSKPSALTNVFCAGVEKEAWVDYIIKRFYKDNAFLQYVFKESDKVLSGRVVHIPNPGAKPQTVKNRSSFPAVAVRRADTDITYVLDEYSVDPTHVHNLEKVELSYDKLDDAYGEQLEVVTETSADDLIVKWASTTGADSAIIPTSGANAPASAPSATGTRKAASHLDIKKMRVQFNKLNVPKADRFALMTEDMYDQIFDSLSTVQQNAFFKNADIATGVLGVLYDFQIMSRSSVAVATVTTNAIKAFGTAGVTTDNEVSIFWQKNSLTFAMGEVKVFDDTDNPLYYGDIMSCALRSGGRVRRADGKGVGLLIQAA
ncbi:MAG: hypothetical protein H7289_07820 [Mucilaginibacter sp.]|nr:hypothetical protein [Mucilaginibacter sp.]